MFTDDTRTTLAAALDVGETLLRQVPATNSNIVITGNMTYVSYGADGQSHQMLGGFLAGQLRVCSTVPGLADTERARLLTINITGRVVVTKPTVTAACA